MSLAYVSIQQHLSAELKVTCQICREIIALADPEALHVPLTGEMFRSIDPVHGYPAPFEPSLTWEFMKCPYCRQRPFITDGEVMTTDGLFLAKSQGASEKREEVDFMKGKGGKGKGKGKGC